MSPESETTAPIIFSTPMVQAIRKGLKSQTRRIINPQPPCDCAYAINGARTHALCYHGELPNPKLWVPPTGRSKDHRLRCPYGGPGTRLWVKETWCNGYGLAAVVDDSVLIAPAGAALAPGVVYAADGAKLPPCVRWRSARFMPRWAARLNLVTTNVRVERVQDITEEDATAEGVDAVSVADVPRQATLTRRDDFAQLWDKINRKRAPFASNPWVWVIDFTRVR